MQAEMENKSSGRHILEALVESLMAFTAEGDHLLEYQSFESLKN